MLPKNVLYYGSEEPLPERTPLRAGPLSLAYEAGDLRYVRLGGTGPEILRRVYVAVRDRNWGTVSPMLSNMQMEIGDNSFHIAYDAEHVENDIDFAWRGTITGDAQGTVRFTMDGVARSTFLRNRIGFCILHPAAECAGQPCQVEKIDGAVQEGVFPYYISPHQPFFDMRAIAHQVAPGVGAEVRFDGDVFEMEDQRNWTDASYKTYCTPLDFPFPVEVPVGTRILQSVTLTLKVENTYQTPVPTAPQRSELVFSIGSAASKPLPSIGLCVASSGHALTQTESARLRALNLSHLRVDQVLSAASYAAALREAAAEANVLGVPLQVAIHLSNDAEAELAALVALIDDVNPRVRAWLVFHIEEKSTSAKWVILAREMLGDYDPSAMFGSGTDAFFTELNRERPPVDVIDLVNFSLNPQVHAFDNASLVETLETQAATVESARQFCGGRPISISPITLKMRFNPNATAAEPKPPPGKLPAQVDVRQMSLFGAAWTTGSLKYVAESGAHNVTYYETLGWRGVMETESGSPLPGVFRSLPAGVFPLYHILADVGEFAGGYVIPTTSSDPLQVDGLALQLGDRTRILLANMSAEPHQVTLRTVSPRVRIRHLDETNALEAMSAPESFRKPTGESVRTHSGALELTLLPYAVARIDSA